MIGSTIVEKGTSCYSMQERGRVRTPGMTQLLETHLRGFVGGEGRGGEERGERALRGGALDGVRVVAGRGGEGRRVCRRWCCERWHRIGFEGIGRVRGGERRCCGEGGVVDGNDVGGCEGGDLHASRFLPAEGFETSLRDLRRG